MGEYSYRPIMEDWVWSYSRISAFDDCPYKFFMHYIDGENENEMFYSSYGSFVHKLHELYYTGKVNAEDLPIVFLKGFSTEVKGKRPSDKIVSEYIEKGLLYFNSFKPFEYDIIGVEKEVHFNVGGFPMVGIIDFIGKDKNDFVIIDHKSRDLKQRSNRQKKTQNDLEIDDKLKQLYLYSTYIKDEYGVFPKYLCFNCFKSGVFIKEQFDTDQYKEAVEWAVKTINDIMDADEFYPRVDFFRCRYLCGLNDRCDYYKMYRR